jgi:hypothetical protein
MTAATRAALITAEEGPPAALIASARHAERVGWRVVTMVDEEPARPEADCGAGLGGPRLRALVARLGQGEFEVIVADAGLGRLVTITAFRESLAGDPRAGENREAAPASVVPSSGARCAIYTRCAFNTTTDPDPLAAQFRTCEAYAADQGWVAAGDYRDVGVSGMSVARDGLRKMMAEAELGAFSVVLVGHLDRLSRNAPDSHGLLNALKALGVTVFIASSGDVTS